MLVVTIVMKSEEPPWMPQSGGIPGARLSVPRQRDRQASDRQPIGGDVIKKSVQPRRRFLVKGSSRPLGPVAHCTI